MRRDPEKVRPQVSYFVTVQLRAYYCFYKLAIYLKITRQALWGEPSTERSVFVDGNKDVPFRGDVTNLCLRARQCTVTQWRRQGPVEREDEMVVPPRALTCPFWRQGLDSSHWLFSQCFRAYSPNTDKQLGPINSHQSRKRSLGFGHQSSISCVWEMGKEGQNSEHLHSEFVSKGSWTSDALDEKTKNGALAQAPFREKIFVNQNQRKAKSAYGICAGFWFNCGGHKAKRSIYIMCILPWTKKITILVMHYVILKNLQSDFAAMHRCVKSRQSQVAFARGFAAESSSLIPRYHKILILCINRMVLFFVQGSIYIYILACQPGVARAFDSRSALNFGASRLWQAPLSFLASRSLKPVMNSRNRKIALPLL